MSDHRSFWRNVTIIGLLHVAVLGGLARWSSDLKKRAAPEILWMDGGAAALVSSLASTTAATAPAPLPADAAPEPQREPEPEPSPDPVVEEDQPMLAATTSEIELPPQTPTPTATPDPTPTPAVENTTPTPKSSPTPKAKRSPKAKRKATPKPTPSASPKKKKTLLAKAEPTAKKKTAKERKAEPTPKPKATSPPSKPPDDNATANATAERSGSGTGRSGTGKGSGGASQFGWYSRMLHDRFYKAWEQPTSVVAAGTRMSALVRIRIEKDGRVTGFNIIRPTGNVLVDESIASVGKRVTRVDPLPAGVGDSHYEVTMNFELTLSE